MNSLITVYVVATAPLWLTIVLPIVALLLGGAVGILVNAKLSQKKLGDAKQLANRMVEEAIAEAKTLRKEAILESKEEIHKQRLEFDKEIKDRRIEVQRTEQRILQKEESLDKKEESLDKKSEALDAARQELKKREDEIAEKKSQVDEAHQRMLAEIEKISGLSRDEAKRELIDAIEDEAKRDAAKLVREIEAAAKEDADKKSREIVSLAIQRCAVDHSSEITVSVVNLPGDDMKGRIIGREGRNIRALENATGIDLIIDDTPDTVVLSGFDPVRREVARISLEKLIADGRIHPARIEEIVEKTKRELETQMKEAGESAMFEAGVFGINAELIKVLGRLKYRTSYGQNVLKHSLEVAHLAGLMAAELGADVNIAKRGGLLHDIGKAVDHEVEGTHVTIGADLAKKYKESKDVIHCIAAHHNDIEPTTVEAILVQCADAISGAKPGARRESLDNYVKRLEKLESIANTFDGVEKSYAIQAGREVRIIVKPDKVDDGAAVFLAKEIAKQIEKEMEYPGQIKVNVIRETRSVEYAK
ncbi:MAG: ribonuclease Y [Clostridiales bacterium]|jgi:ribonuclease Y|nr:ribonuclease Y [Clostridiales bacterium]